ncbi:UNVERIFIED_CONTAM: hypothetical protein GTU68_050808 [Idotea baltica]|nr:hypothetical protein [Idotea baltica]
MIETLKVQLTENSRLPSVNFDELVFGRTFSDHMFVADYYDGQWQDERIVPFAELSLSPATISLHYGQSVFEGMKAEKGADGKVILFRPALNAERLNVSAKRMSMPTYPVDRFIEHLSELVNIDRNWIPTKEGCSLYIRPILFASDNFIGVQTAQSYKLIIFTAPVGAYYSEPVSVKIEEEYVRAFTGGTGFAKAAGNYAPTLLPAKLAKEQGFDQILWTDGETHEYVQEIGTMNVFFIINGVAVTPNLDGNILEGTTRDTVIHLLKDQGVKIQERPLAIKEILEAHEAGTLQDAFGVGTAASIIHIKSIGKGENIITLPELEDRKLSVDLKAKMIRLKRGQEEDVYGWTIKV